MVGENEVVVVDESVGVGKEGEEVVIKVYSEEEDEDRGEVGEEKGGEVGESDVVCE